MADEDRDLTPGTLRNYPAIQQVFNIYRRMPLSRKIGMGAMLVLLLAAFAAMFFWANRIDFQTAYSGLTQEDAAKIVEKLKEQNIPYELSGDGNTIKVPAERVYDVRLAMAAEGLPKGGTVGYELFDETDFGTTDFVQKMNYQRALQGELARTIREFEEVEDARVMIALRKESVFIEETEPPSVSVLLKLRRDLSPEKIRAVVHLVASSLEGMTPERVAVVDTKGRVLFKGAAEEEKLGEQADSQLQYKLSFEKNLTARIQTMLERIVGTGKAIVRVTADMDFDQVDINEEQYDPDVQVVRSRQNLLETKDKISAPGEVSSVNRITAPGQEMPGSSSEKNNKQDETVNYELNRTVKRTIKPVGILKRLSVAAVLDGNYSVENDESGKPVRKYTPRTPQELEQFKGIVRNAMGYSEDREDQVTVDSFPFSATDEMLEAAGIDWKDFWRMHGRSLINVALIVLLFVLIVLPLIKAMKEIKTTVVASLPSPEERMGLPPGAKEQALADPSKMTPKEKARHYAMDDVDKSANILKGWMAET
ncbi:MAG: flagellar basal-body MS-ring/collar protein FliF [Thermodesulfobacteriota bacterium]